MFKNLMSELEGQKITVFLVNTAKLDGKLISVHDDCIILSGKNFEDKNNLIPITSIASVAAF